MTRPREGPEYLPTKGAASPVNGLTTGRVPGRTALANSLARASGEIGPVLFISTTTATAIPMPYRRGVPSLSFEGLTISVYEAEVSTLPPWSARSQAIMSPAVEQSEPAEKGQMWFPDSLIP